MANLTTTSDLVAYVLEGMREKTDGTSPFAAKALTQLNRAWRAIVAGGMSLNTEVSKPVIFPWAKSSTPKVVNLVPHIDTGTVTVTENSTTVTFSDAPASSITGYHFKVDGESEVYCVASHTGGVASATLDAAYVGDSNAAASYVVFKVDYAFGSDVLTPIAPLMAYSTQGPREINIVAKSVLNRDWPMSEITEDMPTVAALVHQDGAGTLTLRFNAYPTGRERVEMDYIAVPAVLDLVSSNPTCPVHQRVVIAEYALGLLFEEVDDDRAPSHIALAKEGISSMIAEAQGITKAGGREFGRILPRLDEVEGERHLITTEDGFIIDMGS